MSLIMFALVFYCSTFYDVCTIYFWNLFFLQRKIIIIRLRSFKLFQLKTFFAVKPLFLSFLLQELCKTAMRCPFEKLALNQRVGHMSFKRRAYCPQVTISFVYIEFVSFCGSQLCSPSREQRFYGLIKVESKTSVWRPIKILLQAFVQKYQGSASNRNNEKIFRTWRTTESHSVALVVSLRHFFWVFLNFSRSPIQSWDCGLFLFSLTDWQFLKTLYSQATGSIDENHNLVEIHWACQLKFCCYFHYH